MYKFRTMTVNAETNGAVWATKNDARVTPIGGMLRGTRLDELPQLVNVLRGEMSLVGPRPLAVDPDDFDAAADRRHMVRPGITGPWQVHGGNALSYDDMVHLDQAYIATWSFLNDLRILLRTIPAVAVRRAAY